MNKKKLLSVLLACGLAVTSATVMPAPAVQTVSAATDAAAFNGITLARSYKALTNHNPCSTLHFSADPGVMEYNGRVYVYATNDGDAKPTTSTNNYGTIKSLNCMSSADLVNWTDHGTIQVAGSTARWAGNSWAPCATHKKINGKEQFFIYFANSGGGIGVLQSDSPTGPWRDPIGGALITGRTPNCGNIEWLFDPAVLTDTDGSSYLYFGGGSGAPNYAHPMNSRVVKLGANMTSIVGTPQTIDAPYIFEDNGIHKVGNTYFYSYCTNWNCPNPGNAKIAYMTSNSPMGPFNYVGTCLDNPGAFFGDGGNNHHTIITFKGEHYIFYHAQWLDKQMSGKANDHRTTFVNKMTYSNGRYGNTRGDLQGVSQVGTLNPFVANTMSTMAWQGGVSLAGSGNCQIQFNRGDWTGLAGVAFGGGASSIKMRAASPSGATIKICTGSASGPAIGYVNIPATGSMNNYREVSATISGVSGTKDLFFVASGDCAVDTWQFFGGSVPPTVEPTQTATPTPVKDLEDGWYYIKNVNAQKYLQVKDNKGANAQNVEIGTGTGVAGQKWNVKTQDDGSVILINGLGEYALDIANGSAENDANVQIYSAWGGDAQRFYLEKSGDCYLINTKASGGTKSIDVAGSSKEDGANVLQWTTHGRTNQQWVFEKIGGTQPTQTPEPTKVVEPTKTPEPTKVVEPTKEVTTGGVTCEYKVVSDWGSSWQAEIVVTNKSGSTLNGWTLTCDYNSKINNLWGAELVGQTGTKVTVKNPSWDANLANGSSITISFIAEGTDKSAPTNMVVK